MTYAHNNSTSTFTIDKLDTIIIDKFRLCFNKLGADFDRGNLIVLTDKVKDDCESLGFIHKQIKFSPYLPPDCAGIVVSKYMENPIVK